MPRSNKKKHPLKPQPKHPSSEEMMNCSPEISQIIINERTNMMNRAIHSAKHHGINLKPGPPTPGQGDCAFEAVINNNNERMCFKEKYSLSVTSYRQIWLTDMANRTVDTDWNIFSQQEWLTGWKDMLVPGTYERGIYGDLMLPGIACGIRKFLLIFNTNPQSPHDPIYVVDPRKFNVHPNTAIPIILAYNLAHYESLHPSTNADILASINLSKEYLENRYRYSKKDLPMLLGLEKRYSRESNTKRKDELKSSKPNYVMDELKSGPMGKKRNLSNSDSDENIFLGHRNKREIQPNPKKSPSTDKKVSKVKPNNLVTSCIVGEAASHTLTFQMANLEQQKNKKGQKKQPKVISEPNSAKLAIEQNTTFPMEDDIDLQEIDNFLDEEARKKMLIHLLWQQSNIQEISTTKNVIRAENL